jgi:ribosomal protein L29
MTEPLGRRATWRSALVLAPGAAALLGGAVWWAAAAVPTTATAPQPAPTTQPATAPPTTAQVRTVPDPLARSLAAQIRSADRHNQRLAQRLSSLQRQLARLRHQAATAGSGAVPRVTTVIPPSVVDVTVAAPPPPVHATTRASG